MDFIGKQEAIWVEAVGNIVEEGVLDEFDEVDFVMDSMAGDTIVED